MVLGPDGKLQGGNCRRVDRVLCLADRPQSLLSHAGLAPQEIQPAPSIGILIFKGKIVWQHLLHDLALKI